jgi:NADH-quinone oxidoreductase subunit A
MLFQYAHVLIGFVFGMLFVAVNIYLLVRLLSPRVPDAQKASTYECGEPPVGDAWIRFDMRFYTMALIFIIFEVEAVFLFPWAAVYNGLIKSLGGNLFPFVEALFFIAILTVGLVYVWKKGDMDWVKSALTNKAAPAALPVAASRSVAKTELLPTAGTGK